MGVAGRQPAGGPPAVLQITIECLRDGAEARYGALEECMAEACGRLGCPNAYLALESVDGPKEVWWIVDYADDADRVVIGSHAAPGAVYESAERLSFTFVTAVSPADAEHAARRPRSGRARVPPGVEARSSVPAGTSCLQMAARNENEPWRVTAALLVTSAARLELVRKSGRLAFAAARRSAFVVRS